MLVESESSSVSTSVPEATATNKVFGNSIPYSTLKSYLGHTLGACGAVETWLAIEMMRRNWFAPTLNLKTVDERCPEIDYIREEGREMNIDTIMCNNFAFGGINTSLVIRRL